MNGADRADYSRKPFTRLLIRSKLKTDMERNANDNDKMSERFGSSTERQEAKCCATEGIRDEKINEKFFQSIRLIILNL